MKMQKELRNKQSTLQQAVKIAEDARNDAAEANRKITVSQELVETFKAEAREARVQLNNLTRANELVEAKHADLLQRLEDAKSESRSAQSRDIEKDTLIDNLRAQLRQHEEDAEAAITDLQNSYDVLNIDHTKLSSKHAPLELEVSSLKQEIRRYATENQKLKSDITVQKSRTSDAEAKASALEGTGLKYKNMHDEVKTKHAEEEAKSTHLMSQLREVQDRHADLQADVRQREEDLAKRNVELQNTHSENKSLEVEFQNLANDMTALVSLRDSDQERFKAQIDELQGQLSAALEADRRRTQQYRRDLQHAETSHVRDQKEKEEQYIKLQEEHAELHMLLKTMQDKHQEAAQQLLEETSQSRDRIRDHQEALRAKESAHASEMGDAAAKLAKSEEDVAALRQEAIDRAGRYQSTIVQLQRAVKALESDLKRMTAEKVEFRKDLKTLQDFLVKTEPSHSAVLEDWYSSMKDGMAAMIEQNKAHRNNTLDAEDRHRSEQTEKESIRAKAIMLEDRVDSLEHEKDAEVQRRLQMEREHQKHLENADLEKERLRAKKSDADERARALQKRLDASTSQGSALQREAHSAKLELNTAKTKHEHYKAQMDDKISVLQQQLEERTHEHEDTASKHEEIVARYAALDTEKQDLHQQLEFHKQALQQASSQGKVSLKKQQQLLQQRDTTLSNTKQQLETTKKMLVTVKEQVRELSDENESLRNQMDSIQAARLDSSRTRGY